MKNLINLVVVAFCAIFLLTSGAMAVPVTKNLGDTPWTENNSSAYWWKGWKNGDPNDNKDVIGVPDFENNEFNGGYATFDDFDGSQLYLVGLRVIVNNATTSSVVSPGDLFLSTDNDKRDGANPDWDYFVDLTHWSTYNSKEFSSKIITENPRELSGTDFFVYDIDGQGVNAGNVDSSNYILSGSDNTDLFSPYRARWNGYEIRDDHPVAYDNTWGNATGKIGEASYSGWGSVVDFTFDKLIPVNYDDTVIIGWAVNCANDVLYEEVVGPSGNIPVPEPATLLLIGSGLIGLGAFSRKRIRKQAKR